MLTRNICRGIAPAFKVYISAASNGVKYDVFSSSRISSKSPAHISAPRLYSQKRKLQEDIPELAVVDYEYVKKAAAQNEVIIIDVREPIEIKEYGKIPNSINIPIGFVESTLEMSEDEFKAAFKRPKPGVNEEIIFYCKLGRRSGMAQRCAVNLGFKNTKNYLGSWTEWVVKHQ